MTDEIIIADKSYISSKRASELSGYAQDYIGQLARKGHIDAQRVGGLWYIFSDSLLEYKENAENQKPEPPNRANATQQNPDTLVFFDGKEFISANRASEITGYSQDYVGQLARSEKVSSRQVGTRWYVERESIVNHKREKDALLAAVQAQSVGISRSAKASLTEESVVTDDIDWSGPFFTYTHEDRDLMPSPSSRRTAAAPEDLRGNVPEISLAEQSHSVPIRIIRSSVPDLPRDDSESGREESLLPRHDLVRIPGKTIQTIVIPGMLLVIVVVVLSVSFVHFRNTSLFTFGSGREAVTEETAIMYAASIGTVFEGVSLLLERWLVPEIMYRREENSK